MPYVIQNVYSGRYVTGPGAEHSYTKYLQQARVFATLQEAKANRCDQSERILRVEDAFTVAGN